MERALAGRGIPSEQQTVINPSRIGKGRGRGTALGVQNTNTIQQRGVQLPVNTAPPVVPHTTTEQRGKPPLSSIQQLIHKRAAAQGRGNNAQIMKPSLVPSGRGAGAVYRPPEQQQHHHHHHHHHHQQQQQQQPGTSRPTVQHIQTAASQRQQSIQPKVLLKPKGSIIRSESQGVRLVNQSKETNHVVLRRTDLEEKLGVTIDANMQLGALAFGNSPARRAGLENYVNRKITHVNNQEVTTITEFREAARNAVDMALRFEEQRNPGGRLSLSKNKPLADQSRSASIVSICRGITITYNHKSSSITIPITSANASEEVAKAATEIGIKTSNYHLEDDVGDDVPFELMVDGSEYFIIMNSEADDDLLNLESHVSTKSDVVVVPKGPSPSRSKLGSLIEDSPPDSTLAVEESKSTTPHIKESTPVLPTTPVSEAAEAASLSDGAADKEKQFGTSNTRFSLSESLSDHKINGNQSDKSAPQEEEEEEPHRSRSRSKSEDSSHASKKSNTPEKCEIAAAGSLIKSESATKSERATSVTTLGESQKSERAISERAASDRAVSDRAVSDRAVSESNPEDVLSSQQDRPLETTRLPSVIMSDLGYDSAEERQKRADERRKVRQKAEEARKHEQELLQRKRDEEEAAANAEKERLAMKELVEKQQQRIAELEEKSQSPLRLQYSDDDSDKPITTVRTDPVKRTRKTTADKKAWISPKRHNIDNTKSSTELWDLLEQKLSDKDTRTSDLAGCTEEELSCLCEIELGFTQLETIRIKKIWKKMRDHSGLEPLPLASPSSLSIATKEIRGRQHQVSEGSTLFSQVEEVVRASTVHSRSLSIQITRIRQLIPGAKICGQFNTAKHALDPHLKQKKMLYYAGPSMPSLNEIKTEALTGEMRRNGCLVFTTEAHIAGGPAMTASSTKKLLLCEVLPGAVARPRSRERTTGPSPHCTMLREMLDSEKRSLIRDGIPPCDTLAIDYPYVSETSREGQVATQYVTCESARVLPRFVVYLKVKHDVLPVSHNNDHRAASFPPQGSPVKLEDAAEMLQVLDEESMYANQLERNNEDMIMNEFTELEHKIHQKKNDLIKAAKRRTYDTKSHIMSNRQRLQEYIEGGGSDPFPSLQQLPQTFKLTKDPAIEAIMEMDLVSST